MKRMLVNASHADELRVAITDNAVLTDLTIEHPGLEQKKSNIYKGRITSIEPSLGAVFVDYGSERHGFLPVKEISPEYFLTKNGVDISSPDLDIKKILKEGQEIVIQVDKEERGTKGAALTSFISLAGSYLVLMPNNPRAGGISRRIEGEDRDQLREIISQLSIPDGMGIIIRTAGVNRTQEELAWDLKVLLRYWEAIKQAAVAKPGPYLIHQESDIIIRTIRDNLRQDISEIIIDDLNAFQRAREYIRQIRPDFIEHVKMYSDSMPLFSRFQIEQQIEAAYQREVRLPSGGSIVIDHSEALVAIDINSARATKGSSIEETALHTNLEAADEIAKQLRIRDIGGLVVIDFIDMSPARNQREVENRLRNALHLDRARIQIGRISRFGLLEMSRQRLRSSLNMSTQITCPRCEGRGTVRGIESIALSVVHLIQEHASRGGNIHIQVQLPVDVATYLINEKRDALKEVETHSTAKITIIPNHHLDSPHYYLKTSKDEHSKLTPSYKLMKVPKADSFAHKPVLPPSISEPAIQQYLSDDIHKIGTGAKKQASSGLIKRLWDIMFGNDPVSKKPVQKIANLDRKIQPRRKKPVGEQRKPTRAKSTKDGDGNKVKPEKKAQDGKKQRPRRTQQGKAQRRGQRPQRKKQDNKNRETKEMPKNEVVAAPAPAPEQKPVETTQVKAPEKPKTMTAPTQSAVAYQTKSMPTDKPLQQVTTKKSDKPVETVASEKPVEIKESKPQPITPPKKPEPKKEVKLQQVVTKDKSE